MATSKAAFMSAVYSRPNHVPSLDLGAFDVTVDPKKGRVEICTRVHLMTQSQQAQLTLTKFGKQFSKIVPQVWDKQAKFVCTTAGWNDIVLVPHFKVDIVGLSSCHFRVEIKDEDETSHFQGPAAAIKPDTYSGAGTSPTFAPRVGEFGASATLQGEVDAYRRDIVYSLANGLVIPIKTGPTEDSRARERFTKYAREIMALKVPRKFKSSKRPTLTITGCGPGNRQNLASAAQKWLVAAGVKNPMVLKSNGDTKPPDGVVLSFDKAELNAMFPKQTASRKSLFQHITVAHEYGHMLGLPDEYLCMSSLSKDAMQDVYAMKGPEIQSFEGKAGMQIADVKVLPDGTRHVPHIVKHQADFIRLCAKANLTPPEFKNTTTSIMSQGMVFHPHHFVTLWEAVKITSGVEDWRIEMK